MAAAEIYVSTPKKAVTANGLVSIAAERPRATHRLKITGTFDTATVALAYKDADGNTCKIVDSAGTQISFSSATTEPLIVVADATVASWELTVATVGAATYLNFFASAW